MRATHPWIRLSVNRLFSDRTAVQVSVDTSELDDGRTYAGAVVVDSVVFGSRKVPVSVNVTGSVKPALRVSPTMLDFGQLRFGQPPKVMELRLANAGEGYLTGTLRPRQSWISTSQGAFAGNNVALQVMASADGLMAGLAYEGEIDISSNAGPGLVFARLDGGARGRAAAGAPAPGHARSGLPGGAAGHPGPPVPPHRRAAPGAEHHSATCCAPAAGAT